MTTIARPKMPKPLFRTLAAAAAVVVCMGASAADLPIFTLDPAAVGLAGPAFTADNLLISDYAKVTKTATGFTETGYLAITGAQLGSLTFQPTGLASTYGLYIEFSAAGTNTFAVGNFSGVNIDSLTYTLYGYNGAANFTPTSAPAPFVTLGSGTLESGTFSGTTNAGNVTSVSATFDLNFVPSRGSAASFFVSPVPFYTSVQSAFNNTSSQITNTATGFTLSQGGGSINFIATPVPEPETYAMLLAGLGVVGGLALRRNKAKKSGQGI